MATYFGGSRGRKREFADNLNLVPFIDLFSTIIIFLLATAVWDQLGAIKANIGTSQGRSSVRTSENEKVVKADVKATITDKFVLLFDAGKTQRIAIENGKILDLIPMTAFVNSVREKYPEKRDAVIEATDEAKYENLILIMDQFMSQQFDDLVVKGLGGGN